MTQPALSRLRRAEDLTEKIPAAPAKPAPAKSPKTNPPKTAPVVASAVKRASPAISPRGAPRQNHAAGVVGAQNVVTRFFNRLFLHPETLNQEEDEALEVAEGDEEESGDSEPVGSDVEDLTAGKGVVNEARSESDSDEKSEDDEYFVVDDDVVEYETPDNSEDQEEFLKEKREERREQLKKKAAQKRRLQGGIKDGTKPVLHIWTHKNNTLSDDAVLAPLLEPMADVLTGLFLMDFESDDSVALSLGTLSAGQFLLSSVGSEDYEDLMGSFGAGEATGKFYANKQEKTQARKLRTERYEAYCQVRTVLLHLFYTDVAHLKDDFQVVVHKEESEFDQEPTTWDLPWRLRQNTDYKEALLTLLNDKRAVERKSLIPGVVRLSWGHEKYVEKLQACVSKFNTPARQMLFSAFQCDTSEFGAPEDQAQAPAQAQAQAEQKTSEDEEEQEDEEEEEDEEDQEAEEEEEEEEEEEDDDDAMEE